MGNIEEGVVSQAVADSSPNLNLLAVVLYCSALYGSRVQLRHVFELGF